MSVNLQKGQKVELRKPTGGALTSVMVGLGWDEAPRAAEGKSGGLFSLFGSKKHGAGEEQADFDCDASAFLCKGGKVANKSDVVYFGNLMHSSGSVRHMGDNLTGAGEGDDEQIMVNLQTLPEQYDRVIFVVNIYSAQSRGQHFGMIQNAFIRICDDKGTELCRYDLTERYNGMTAMVFGELYRHNGAWKFNAIGQPTTDNRVEDLIKRFQ